MPTISQRINEALNIREMKQADLVRLTGIGKSSISTYLSGEYEPKQRNIYKIAKALNVNEAWLMGYDVPMEKPTLNTESELDEKIRLIYNKLSKLSRENLDIALAQLDVLIDHQEKRGKKQINHHQE